MSSCRHDRDAILAAASPWAWRSTRQGAVRKAREVLELKVTDLARRLQALEASLNAGSGRLFVNAASPCPQRITDLELKTDFLSARLDDWHRNGYHNDAALQAFIQTEVERQVQNLKQHADNSSSIANARLDGLHGKMERMTDANKAQIDQLHDKFGQLQETMELFSGHISAISTELSRLPGEQLIKDMVDQSKAYLDSAVAAFTGNVDQQINDKLNRYDSKMADVFLTHKNDLDDKVNIMAAALCRVQRGNVESTSEIIHKNKDFETRLFATESQKDKILTITKHCRSHNTRLTELESKTAAVVTEGSLLFQLAKVENELMHVKKSFGDASLQHLDLISKVELLEKRSIQGPSCPLPEDILAVVAPHVQILLAQHTYEKDEAILVLQQRVDACLQTSDLQTILDHMQRVTSNSIDQSLAGIVARMSMVADRVSALENRC